MWPCRYTLAQIPQYAYDNDTWWKSCGSSLSNSCQHTYKHSSLAFFLSAIVAHFYSCAQVITVLSPVLPQCAAKCTVKLKVILLSIHYNINFLVICCWGLKRRIVISLSRKERELDTYLYLGHCTACHIETSGLWSQVSAEGKWGEEKWSTRLISKPTLKKKKNHN